MYDQLPQPTIFAHRGSSAYAPENTLAAFELAVRQNANAIEIDVKLSSDGHVIVIHDASVNRTTDGEGQVSELTLASLKSLDAGCKYDNSFCGEKIPTLDEVFESVGVKTFTNVELTNYATPKDQLPEKVAQIVQSHGMQDRVLFSSFNPFSLRKIHNILPNIPIGLLSLPGIAGTLSRSFLVRWLPYKALHPDVRSTSRNLIARFQKRGNRIHTYTVNHPEDMEKFFKWGINGIFTDDPPLAIRTLLNFQEGKSKSA
jgi:glycerophosphoryl diester phosphodiesterase